MTPAEFKARREALGLTAQWLADHFGVALFSVKRWERDRKLPDSVEEEFERLEERADTAVQLGAALDGPLIVPRTDDQSPDDFPAAYHRAIALRISHINGAPIIFKEESDG